MEQAYKGIIFDFNGTLFWDTDKQKGAWQVMAEKLRGTAVTDHEMATFILGRPNKVTIEYMVGHALPDEQIAALVDEKETVYRELCRLDAANTVLAPGALDLLNYLKAQQIPCNIATGSEISNVDFYYEVFHLERWVPYDTIVYDDGLLPGKPFPEIYIKAAEKIGLLPQDCIVFEDADSGVEAAYRAQIGRTIAIGPVAEHERLAKLTGVAEVVLDFTQFNRDCLVR